MATEFHFITPLPPRGNVGDRFNYPLMIALRNPNQTLCDPMSPRKTLYVKIRALRRSSVGSSQDVEGLDNILGLVKTEARASYWKDGWSYFIFGPEEARGALTIRESWRGKSVELSAKAFAKDEQGEEKAISLVAKKLPSDEEERDMAATTGPLSVFDEWTDMSGMRDVRVHTENRKHWIANRPFIYPTDPVYEWAKGPMSSSPHSVILGNGGDSASPGLGVQQPSDRRHKQQRDQLAAKILDSSSRNSGARTVT